eukprot:TRINITY_DN55667_c0_g1_i1.p1 TRINITY_DN55667_c0_g1~~TRINITY_DN55667_c0_g1_i1.p1  ORF type:complete len:130 (-),score=11.14 TRINITY_DN55667_c0_g1_i1:24-377(-)
MGRSESSEVPSHGDVVVKAKAISGLSTVVLVWDVPLAASRQRLAGFAISRTSGAHRQWLLSGGRRFKNQANICPVAELEAKLANLKIDECAESAKRKLSVSGQPQIGKMVELTVRGF